MVDHFERICGNCNHFFPDTSEPTENGICLADEVFDPYLDDLLEYGDFSRCRQLIEEKRFHHQHDVCSLYEEAEIIELPADIALEDLVENLPDLQPEDERPRETEFSFQEYSFAWLLEHDEGLRNLRQKYQKCSVEERRKTADFEYHAASADHLFNVALDRAVEPQAIPGEAVALAIDPSFAPAILTVGTHEYILGRTEEAKRLLLSLTTLPEHTEDLPVIIDKAARFLIERQDIDMAMNLYSAACLIFADEPTFQDGLAYCLKRNNDEE